MWPPPSRKLCSAASLSSAATRRVTTGGSDVRLPCPHTHLRSSRPPRNLRLSDEHTKRTGGDHATIFHNPSCSNSRGALGLLKERSVDHEVVEYLVTPPDREALEMIVAKLLNPVTELVRTTDPKFVALGLDPTAYVTPDQIVDLLLEHPELMQRPVVMKGDRAVIARPSDRVSEVLA
jgi:arsenate reductase